MHLTEETLTGVKCISKTKRLLALPVVLVLVLTGCGFERSVSFNDAYNCLESAVLSDAKTDSSYSKDIEFFASDLCVAENKNTVSDNVSDYVIEAMGVFLPASKKISYQKNIHQKMYPASTTKIMTAYLAFTYGDLNDFVTISENAVDQASDSSVCGLPSYVQLLVAEVIVNVC